MGDVINLKQARKARARAAKESAAAENRVLHGRTHGQKQREKIEKLLDARRLDGHKQDQSDSEDPPGST